MQARGHCPGSISREVDDSGSAVQTCSRSRRISPSVGDAALQPVIHRSYPQALRFHVKHLVDGASALWIHAPRGHDPSAMFHVKQRESGFSTAVTHSLWIVLLRGSTRTAHPLSALPLATSRHLIDLGGPRSRLFHVKRSSRAHGPGGSTSCCSSRRPCTSIRTMAAARLTGRIPDHPSRLANRRGFLCAPPDARRTPAAAEPACRRRWPAPPWRTGGAERVVGSAVSGSHGGPLRGRWVGLSVCSLDGALGEAEPLGSLGLEVARGGSVRGVRRSVFRGSSTTVAWATGGVGLGRG